MLRKLHFVWVDDEDKRPDTLIQTWLNLNPKWEFRIWGQDDLRSYPWFNKEQSDEERSDPREKARVENLLRWEILHNYGGFMVEPDSICLRPLEDWLFDAPMVISKQDNTSDSELLSATPIYAEPFHPLVTELLKELVAMPAPEDPKEWEALSSARLLSIYKQNPSLYQVKFLESYHFAETHFSESDARNDSMKFAKQFRARSNYSIEESHQFLPEAEVEVNGLSHNLYFAHRLIVHEQRELDRATFFSERLQGAKVLHVGFVDYPITTTESNLHLTLSEVCREIVGYDINKLGAEKVRPYLPPHQQRMYFDLKEIGQEHFDWVIVPEVLEHVDNIQLFLSQITRCNAENFIFTVPDAFALSHFYQKRSENEAYEIVHPDHNCWFSPYTLQNVITKFTALKVVELIRIDISIAAICRKHGKGSALHST